MNRLIELLFGVSAAGIAAVCALSLHLHWQNSWARVDAAVDASASRSDRLPACQPGVEAEALLRWVGDLELGIAVSTAGKAPVAVTVSGSGALEEWQHPFLQVQMDLDLTELVSP